VVDVGGVELGLQDGGDLLSGEVEREQLLHELLLSVQVERTGVDFYLVVLKLLQILDFHVHEINPPFGVLVGDLIFGVGHDAVLVHVVEKLARQLFEHAETEPLEVLVLEQLDGVVLHEGNLVDAVLEVLQP